MSYLVPLAKTSLESAVTATAASIATALDGSQPPGGAMYQLVSSTNCWWAQGIADTVFTANSGDTFVVASQATGKFTIAAHGLPTGFGPAQLTTSSALPSGLLTSTNYWVIAVDANTIQLTTSLANALAGTFVAVTDNGTGTQTLDPSIFTVTLGHKLTTGDALEVSNSGGALPTGLSAATVYWAQIVTSTTFKLYDTRAHALVASGATGLVTISDNGTGTQTATTTATVGSGSSFLPLGVPVAVDGSNGAKISIVRDTASGAASITQCQVVK